MFRKLLTPTVLLAITLLTPSLVDSQTNDTSKVPSSGSPHSLMPSHSQADSAKAPSGPDTDTIFSEKDWVVIETHHRMYPSFRQVDTIKPRQQFQLGDDGPFGQVVKFVADLKVTMKGEKIKMSDTLVNPAVLVQVILPDTATHKDSLVQESWAFFYGGAPHFPRNAFFAFKLLDFNVDNPKYVKLPEKK